MIIYYIIFLYLDSCKCFVRCFYGHLNIGIAKGEVNEEHRSKGLNLPHNFCKIRHRESGGAAETLVESDYAAL